MVRRWMRPWVRLLSRRFPFGFGRCGRFESLPAHVQIVWGNCVKHSLSQMCPKEPNAEYFLFVEGFGQACGVWLGNAYGRRKGFGISAWPSVLHRGLWRLSCRHFCLQKRFAGPILAIGFASWSVGFALAAPSVLQFLQLWCCSSCSCTGH